MIVFLTNYCKMKSLLQLVTLSALICLLWKPCGAPPETPKPPGRPTPPPLIAPLIPPFTLSHPQPGFLDKIRPIWDTDYSKCIAILAACRVDEIRPIAIETIEPENTDRPLNLGQLCDIYDAAKRWSYVNDPASGDYFATPIESHRSLRGDCDDYAIYLACLLSAVGFESVITIGEAPSGEYHAYPEVCLGAINSEIVCNYLGRRYELSAEQPIHVREDEQGNLYLSLDHGFFPGAVPFKGEELLRLYLTDQYIEKL
mgnify:CR=1 FL=1